MSDDAEAVVGLFQETREPDLRRTLLQKIRLVLELAQDYFIFRDFLLCLNLTRGLS